MGGVEPPSERISSGTSPGAESCLRFPSPGANSHAQGSGSFIVHGALKALRTHVHHLSTPRPGPWSSRAGRSPLMQREELRCRCSLIYKFARFKDARRIRPLFPPQRPRRNRYIPLFQCTEHKARCTVFVKYGLRPFRAPDRRRRRSRPLPFSSSEGSWACRCSLF